MIEINKDIIRELQDRGYKCICGKRHASLRKKYCECGYNMDGF